MPRRVQASVEIDAPVAIVYQRISAFELYPEFVPGLVAVHRVSARRLRMVAEIAGSEHEWRVRVIEQRRERSVAIALEQRFQAAAHARMQGAGAAATELTLSVEYELDVVRERLLGLVFDPQPQLEVGLERFRDWVHEGQAAGPRPRTRRSAVG